MNFTEKLSRLTADRSKSEVARAASLSATTISNYIARGSLPRYDIAVRIARAVGVSVEWMLDDAADFPPPAPIVATETSGKNFDAVVSIHLTIELKGAGASPPVAEA